MNKYSMELNIISELWDLFFEAPTRENIKRLGKILVKLRSIIRRYQTLDMAQPETLSVSFEPALTNKPIHEGSKLVH